MSHDRMLCVVTCNPRPRRSSGTPLLPPPKAPQPPARSSGSRRLRRLHPAAPSEPGELARLASGWGVRTHGFLAQAEKGTATAPTSWGWPILAVAVPFSAAPRQKFSNSTESIGLKRKAMS